VALPFLVVDVAEVGRDVVWRKAFKLAISPRGRCRDRDMPALEAEGVDSMLKLASSFRMVINEREMMLQIQLTVVMGRGLGAGEEEIEQRYRSEAYKILQLKEVLATCPILIIRVYSGPDLSFCFVFTSLVSSLVCRQLGSLCFLVIGGE